MTDYKSNLHKVALITATDYWNDSCSIQELTYAIDQGAVGATTNPTIVVNVLKKEMHLWVERIQKIIADNPTYSEEQVTWLLIEEMAVCGAVLLKPIYERENGLKGRLSIQTNPTYYRNAQAIVDQTIHFNSLAPNIQVKLPVTKAGVQAIEESTYQGVSINATVCFSVPQAIAAAAAVERGLERRTAEGKNITDMAPVITIMVGRTDDWLKIAARRDEIDIDPAILDWAGIACFKKAYQVFQERGFRVRLLVAAYRHLGHIFELIGGNTLQTIPYEWQLKANAAEIDVRERITDPIDPTYLETMLNLLPDFRKAYEPDGMTVDEFDAYGATVRTLRGFIESYHELQGVIRDFMLPNPGIKAN